MQDPALLVEQWFHAHLKPAIDPVGATHSIDDFQRLAGFNRVKPLVHHGIGVFWMHDADPIKILHFSRLLADKVQQPLGRVFSRSVRSAYHDHSRNAFSDETKLAFARLKRLFGALAVINVRVRSIPFYNPALVIKQGVGAVYKPAILPVVTPHA